VNLLADVNVEWAVVRTLRAAYRSDQAAYAVRLIYYPGHALSLHHQRARPQALAFG
jgi:hypothetical protein